MRTHPVPEPVPDWRRTRFSAAGYDHPVYRRGSGPAVVVVPELPGPTPRVFGFADEVVAAGFEVAVPHLFGRVAEPLGVVSALRSIGQVCVSREFSLLAAGQTSPVAGWLRALCRQLHAEAGGPGVGVVGMCFTGGFALAAMVDPAVVAPVVAQPSVPLPLGARRRGDLQLSPDDLAVVRQRARSGCPVLGIRYKDDHLVGARFDTLAEVLDAAFVEISLPGRKHSTLTEHRDEGAVREVLAFLRRQLPGRPASP